MMIVGGAFDSCVMGIIHRRETLVVINGSRVGGGGHILGRRSCRYLLRLQM